MILALTRFWCWLVWAHRPRSHVSCESGQITQSCRRCGLEFTFPHGNAMGSAFTEMNERFRRAWR